ncbi:MAG TPA: TonB-dependent receptor [Bacteroidetes bacterium]|nr:TonB-dependent receptor [Bacteroidota bacterium]
MKKNYVGFILSFTFLLLGSALYGQREVGRDKGKAGPHIITVAVEDAENKKPLIGASVLVIEKGGGDVTDKNGRAKLSLQNGIHTLTISYLGYETISEKIRVVGPGLVRFRLTTSAQTMQEIIIEAAADKNVKSTDVGKQVMSIEKIEALPPFVGEPDILKSITLLPGVSTVGEASAGFNVRGSNVDQNLILLGGAPLYNPSHLFGYFSAFNTELLQDVSIYKGGIPANYGGRASSIIDLRFKRGNQEKWEGKSSIGLIAAKTSVGGPVFTNKLTLMLAGRTTYSNWLLKEIKDVKISQSEAGFYDVNAILDYDFTDDFSVRYSFYRSFDKFNLAGDNRFSWSNQNHVVSFNKSFKGKFLINLQAVQANYHFTIFDDDPFSSFRLDSRIRDEGINLGLKYFFNEKDNIAIGVQTKLVHIQPGDLEGTNPESPVPPVTVESEKANESGIYFQHNIELGRFVGLSYGLRYNEFRLLGPNAIPVYAEILPRNEENIVSFTEYADGETIQKYTGLEPRISLRLLIDDNTSFKAGYNRMFQYIHLISNTTTIAPTDVWKLSDPYIKPQEVIQYSAGIFRNFKNNSVEASVEFFYKDIKNIIDYKDGATLLLNNNLESDLLNGKGEAYGVELYLEKKKGDFTGWISYTFSRSTRRVIGSYPEETINDGEWYNASYDKPHNFSLVGDYQLGKRTKLSAIFTYSTGRPVTYPVAKFDYFGGGNIAYYDKRNGNRAPDYHRLDLNLAFGFNNDKKWLAGDFILSVYNVYGRKNAFSVFFDDVPGAPPQAFRLSVLGIPFPSLSYQFKF